MDSGPPVAGRPWRDPSAPTPATTMRGRARSIRAGRRVSGSAYGERLRRKRVPTGRRDRGATAPRRKEPPAPEAGAGTVGTGAQPPQAKAELLYAVLRRQGRPGGRKRGAARSATGSRKAIDTMGVDGQKLGRPADWAVREFGDAHSVCNLGSGAIMSKGHCR